MMIYISTENLSVDGIESTRVAVQSRCQRILQTESGREYGGWFFTDVHDRRWHDQLPGWAIRQHQFLTCISLSITMSMVCTIRFCPANLMRMGNIFTLFLHVDPYSISPIQICSALVILCLKFVLFVSLSEKRNSNNVPYNNVTIHKTSLTPGFLATFQVLVWVVKYKKTRECLIRFCSSLNN